MSRDEARSRAPARAAGSSRSDFLQSLGARISQDWWRGSPGGSQTARDSTCAPLHALLSVLASLYGALLRVRRLAYRHGWRKTLHLDRPTLVIGNRIVGGAGKTPCTLALAQALQLRGWHPGIVSRGYGREGDGVLEVRLGLSNAQEVGDEPLLMARRSGVPVWVGRDRHAAGCALLHAHPEVDLILCDDGLQHLRLGRDAELIVYDERGIGNGALLPLGPLREPDDAESTAQYQWCVDNLASTKTAATPLDGAASQQAGAPVGTPHWTARRQLAGALPLQAWWQGARPEDWLSWSDLQGLLSGARALAVAGIAEPERFFRALTAQGLDVQGRPCVDHADHAVLPFDRNTAHVLVTEKDAVKLDPLRLARERPRTRVWVIPMTLDLPVALINEMDVALRRFAAAR